MRRERLGLLVATAFGTGRAPVVPGTFGSVVGVVLAWATATSGGPWAAAAVFAIVTVAGFWSAGIAETALGRTDPRPVVVDEVAGQMLTLLFLPPEPLVLALGFVVFRVLDVTKPPPARQLERLRGGSGIMADDLAAGVYGNVIVRAAVAFLPLGVA